MPKALRCVSSACQNYEQANRHARSQPKAKKKQNHIFELRSVQVSARFSLCLQELSLPVRFSCLLGGEEQTTTRYFRKSVFRRRSSTYLV